MSEEITEQIIDDFNYEEEKKDGGAMWFFKGKGDPIKVEVSPFHGRVMLNIRTWYLAKDKESGKHLDSSKLENYKPTQKGISVNMELGRKIMEAGLKLLDENTQTD